MRRPELAQRPGPFALRGGLAIDSAPFTVI
jgi:hypothetical protein